MPLRPPGRANLHIRSKNYRGGISHVYRPESFAKTKSRSQSSGSAEVGIAVVSGKHPLASPVSNSRHPSVGEWMDEPAVFNRSRSGGTAEWNRAVSRGDFLGHDPRAFYFAGTVSSGDE